MPLLVITVGRNVTSTNFYLTETTTTQTTTTVVGVTSSHACIKSIPPSVPRVPQSSTFPQPVPDAAAYDPNPRFSADSGRVYHQVPAVHVVGSPQGDQQTATDEEEEEEFYDSATGTNMDTEFVAFDEL